MHNLDFTSDLMASEFEFALELRKDDHWHVKFLGECFHAVGDHSDLAVSTREDLGFNYG